MITHEFVFPGSSKEFYQKIVNRGTGELLNYLKSDQAMSTRGYVDVDGYEFTIHTLPRVYQHGDVVYRLEFMVEGSKAGVGIWEQIEKDIPPKHELGCVIELFPRIDGRTNIKAVCLHPSFEQEFRSLEQEFRSIFGIDEQDKPGANNSVESSYQQDNLTKREKEVAHLLANGKGDKEIAEELMIESSTAKDHCESISNKWGLGGTTAKRSLKPEAKKRGYGTQPRG